MRVRDKISEVRQWCRRRKLRATHSLLHMVYFAIVFLEGHGLYALAGGALFIFGVFALIMHEDPA